MKRCRILSRQVAAVLTAIIMMMPIVASGSGISAPVNERAWAEDFFDTAWGLKPESLPGALHLADLAGQLSVYGADVDISAVVGQLSVYSKPRFIFTPDGGLVQVNIDINPGKFAAVERQLKRRLGEPNPIIYERMNTQTAFEEKTEWLVGQKTRVSLVSRLTGASLELHKRDFFLQDKPGFDEELGRELLKKVRRYEEQGRILEAASLCQELLNGSLNYYSFTPGAHDALAAYSNKPEVAGYFGSNEGIDFSLLKNLYSSAGDQQWIRLDLGFCAREKLKQQRPDGVDSDDRLRGLSVALCRVQVDRASGRYIVIEQLWLDKSNQIIGGSAVWASREKVWPAAYIKGACETFLEGWFTGGVSNFVRI